MRRTILLTILALVAFAVASNSLSRQEIGRDVDPLGLGEVAEEITPTPSTTAAPPATTRTTQPAPARDAPPPSPPADAPPPAPAPATTTPIKHFVTLMQENHSFDNYFGTYPGADGIPEGVCMPEDPNDPTSRCVKPFHLGNQAIEDLDHSSTTAVSQINGGAMNGFLWALQAKGREVDHAMGYYDDRDIPFYWNVADEYVLFDRFFSSALGGSITNHMFWVTAQGGVEGDRGIPDGGWGDIPTIFDRLEEKGISWKFYVQNYDPSVNMRAESPGDRAAQLVWVPLLNYARYLDNPALIGKVVNLSEYYDDLAKGTLPAVSFIVPSGASEHPPGSIKAGEIFVRGLLNALMRSSAWKDSAFMWTYDDWGGWYDHVNPPRIDEWGYGMRVPTLLVSPYAKRGHIDKTELDYTSMLKFVEENWGVAPLATRDAVANNITGAFDFSQRPREPKFLPATRDVEVVKPSPRRVIYAGYSAAVALPVLLIIVANLLAWRRREDAP